MYDVNVVIQIICRYFRILNYGEKHGVISKKLDIGFYISFKIIEVNKE